VLIGSFANRNQRFTHTQGIHMHNTTVTFDTINFDQLSDVTGGINWGEVGRASAGGAVGGALGGAAGGAATGALAGGVGALPGAGIGALGGGIAGAVGGGVNNFGQQMGWWR
jgi:hypothetical protein